VFGLYVVPTLLIDHGNGSYFRGMHLIYYRFPLNRVCCCRISGCEQPSSMSQIIKNLNNLLILFRTTQGSEPRVERKILIHIVELTQGTRPMASCFGFRVVT
jgi:hypothetical protein